MGKASKHNYNSLLQDDLLMNLAEQMKLPFVQISRAIDLLSITKDPHLAARYQNEIKLASSSATRLIDGYLLSVELQQGAQLQLESVSISSILYDAADMLQEYARVHECTLDLEVDGKFGPVMGHRQALLSAMLSLGQSFIEAAVGQSATAKPKIAFKLRRSPQGVSTGIFSENSELTHELFERAKILKGQSRQPFAAFDSGTSSGVFIADALLTQVGSPLRVAKAQGLTGLAATLLPSKQLSLV